MTPLRRSFEKWWKSYCRIGGWIAETGLKRIAWAGYQPRRVAGKKKQKGGD